MTDFDFGERFIGSSDRIRSLRKTIEDRARKSLPFRVAFLDDVSGGIMPSDLILIGAATGAGKTTLGLHLAQMAAAHGTRVKYYALEAHDSEMEQRMVYREMSDLAWRGCHPKRHELSYAYWVNGRCREIHDDLFDQAAANVAERAGKLDTYYRKSKFSVETLTRLILSEQNDTDLIVLDHMHFIDFDERDDNRGMKHVCKTLSDVVTDTETPVIAVAHLRKRDSRYPRLVPDIDDFHGTSDLAKIATKAIVMAPARDAPATSGQALTYMRVVKDRAAGDTGLTARLTFDLRSNSYHDRYELGRTNPMGNEWQQLEDMPPWWAKHASSMAM
jgi:replicative DNA helicase